MIVPILVADFETPYLSKFRRGLRPYADEVAAHHLAKTGLPEVKEYLKELVLEKNPKQLLALWALNLFNKNAKKQDNHVPLHNSDSSSKHFNK